MRRLVVYLAFTTIALCSPALSNPQLIGEDPTLEELFRYSDLVVEGVIEKISKVTVSTKDISPNLISHDMPMAIMAFRKDTVLVGYQTERRIEIVDYVTTTPYHFDFVEGDRYILTLRVPATGGRLFEGARFLAVSGHGKFLIKGSRWIQGDRINPIAEGQLNELYALLGEIQRDRSIERLTQQAELIIRGKVLDMWQGKEQTVEERDKHITRVKLAVQSVMKGAFKSGSLVISMIGVGGYEPLWRTQVPDMHKGEEWIMFLKYADEPGYYPFAGVNGLFLVEGDELIRNNNNRIILPFSPEQLEAEVSQIVK
jgi:hypothetical protein